MLYLCLLMLASSMAYPQATIDPSILIDIFGTPPPTGSSTPGLEDITVGTTDRNSMFVDDNGDTCKCVPYWLCNKDLMAVDDKNVTLTGYGTLDIRFGENKCQETAERCCKSPKTIEEAPRPQPNPSRIRGCGYRNPKGLDVTISGGLGNEAQFGEFPWVIALLDAKDGKYAGVGVLLHPQVVLTGAHIASKFAPGTLKVRAGEWDTQTNKEHLQSQERLVQDIYIHPEFHAKSLRNDLALLRLQEPLQLAEHINVICMPKQDEIFDGSKDCVANGWGKDKFGLKGRYAVILKRVEVNMVPHEQCNKIMKTTRLGYNFRLHNSFVCAGGEAGKDTCQGDGGAPLACPVGDDRYKLTGLVAWGIGCGQNGIPAVYVNVAKFRDFIDSKMAEWGYDVTGYSI